MGAKNVCRIVIILGLTAVVAFTCVEMETTAIAGPGSKIIVYPGDSIQAAIDNANSDDTILIKPGTYTENLNIFKSVTLKGEEPPYVVGVDNVTGGDVREWPVNILGAINVFSSDSLGIINCSIETTADFGLFLVGGGIQGKIVLKDSAFKSSSIAVFTLYTLPLNEVEIDNCLFDTTNLGTSFQGNFGLGIFYGSDANTSITIRNSTFKSAIGMFFNNVAGSLDCSHNDIVSVGYTGHDNALGIYFSNQPGSSACFNQLRIYMNAPEPELLPEGYYYQTRLAIGCGYAPTFGTSCYDATFKNTTIKGIVDAMVWAYGNLQGNIFKNLHREDLIVEEHIIHSPFLGDVISGYEYIFGKSELDGIIMNNTIIDNYVAPDDSYARIYDETIPEDGTLEDSNNILLGRLQHLYGVEGNKAKAFAAALGQSIADDAAEVENAAQQIVQPAPARQYTVTPDNKLATTWGQMKKYK